ncbi:MAG TPA: efflux RND transporter periplasmic adaptor subunit [Gemmatimonadales bacterium]|nr:efflux RND transporter periplasmic adaptor subunit [Gemmatimonadales bacterium]
MALKFLAALLCIIACRQQPDDDATRPVQTGSLAASQPVAVAVADTVTVEVPIVLPSQLYVEHDAMVVARSLGIVESILVDLGARVSAGQQLARLESTDQRIALAQAQEKFAITRQTVERQRELKAAGVVTVADSERVEFEHREAVLALRQAQRDYDLTRIVAPFRGVITRRSTRIHQLVNPGDSLFRVTALRPVLAAIHVPEASAGHIKTGAEAQVVGVDGSTGRGRVIRASPLMDAASGTREMVVQLQEDNPRLTPGSSVSVRLGSERRQIITIPRSAVNEEGYALIWADDKTILRSLQLGREIPDDRVEVVSGLARGEKVMREGP